MKLKPFYPDRITVKRILVALIGLLLTITLSLTFAPKRVVVVVDGESTEYYTYKPTVQGVIEELELSLRQEDKINVNPMDRISNNTTIEIARALQYTIYHDGTKTEVYYHEPDLEQILENAGIEVSKLDIIETNDIEDNRKIHVTRVTEEVFVENTRIYFHEKRVTNTSMYRGQTRVVQQGSEGVKEKAYKAVYHDGEMVEKKLIEESVVKDKQDRIVEYGTVETILRDGRQLAVKRELTVSATAYCSGLEGTGCPVDTRGWAVCTGPYANGYTSLGLRAVPGNGSRENPHIIAVDPTRIPLRSLLYIEGLGFAYAADVGSAIRGNRIDILMENHQEAWKFGRRSMIAYVIER